MYHNLYKVNNLWKFRLNRSSESGENNGETHSCFCTFRRVMTCVISVILAIDNWYCFNVFSKSEAYHWIIFQEKSFTITFCKPCELFVNLWTFFFSVPKVYNGFKRVLIVYVYWWYGRRPCEQCRSGTVQCSTTEYVQNVHSTLLQSSLDGKSLIECAT